MAKTNFTKVEEALAEGLRKIEVNKLLNIADEVSGANKENESKLTAEQKNLLTLLQCDLKFLRKLGKNPFEKSSFNRVEIIKLLKDPSLITEEGWKKLSEFKTHVTLFKKTIEKLGKVKTDDDLVTQQRKKHITKRFNINDDWLPLT